MSDVTTLLARMADGGSDAGAELLSLLYGELHVIAESHFAQQPKGHTLQATALINEAWMKLVRPGEPVPYQGREHFLRTAARAMRQILVDHARSKLRDKRGGGASSEREPLDDVVLADVSASNLIEIDDALCALRDVDAELAELVELRYFGGLPMTEVAAIEGISLSTAERRWRIARTWLRQALSS